MSSPLPAVLVLATLLAGAGVALAQDARRVLVEHGLVYRRLGARSLALDVYRPADPPTAPRPAVVCLHGGSWNSGDRGELAPAARDLAERGFVAATIDYRLAGEARFPAAVADARRAVLWLRANAARFDVDPHRIGVFGPSAGGHVALMVATLPRTVAACAVWCAPTDLVRGMTGGDAVPRPSLEAVERFLGTSFDVDRNTWRRASPAARVTRDTPPLFVAHGDRDPVVPFSQARYLEEAAQARGVEVTLLRVRGAGHELPEAAVWERTVAFLTRALGPVDTLRASAE